MLELISILFFLLTFLLVYGMLNKLKIFPITVNAVVAVCVAFYSILTYFIFAEDIQSVLAWAGVVIIAGFGIAMLYLSLRKRSQ